MLSCHANAATFFGAGLMFLLLVRILLRLCLNSGRGEIEVSHVVELEGASGMLFTRAQFTQHSEHASHQ